MDAIDIEILFKAAFCEANEFVIVGPRIEKILRQFYLADLGEGYKLEDGLTLVASFNYSKFLETKNNVDVYVDPYMDEHDMNVLLDGMHTINFRNVEELNGI